MAVVVEVSDSGYCPGDIRDSDKANRIGMSCAVHQPDHIFTGSSIVPDDVCLAVYVEVSCCGYLPVDVRKRFKGQLLHLGRTVHQPAFVFTSRVISP